MHDMPIYPALRAARGAARWRALALRALLALAHGARTARAAQRAWRYLTRRVWQLLEAERRILRLQQVLTPMSEIVAWTTIFVRVPRNG